MDDGRELEMADGTQLTALSATCGPRGNDCFSLTDITEERRLQAELEQNRRLATMGEMAARLAHQIRTPLSTALLYANHLTDSELDCIAASGFWRQVAGAPARSRPAYPRHAGFCARSAPGRPREMSLSPCFV